MPRRGILFDLDGTLVDSLSDIASSLNHVLAEMGLPVHPLSAYRTMVGDGASELVRRALPADRRDALHDEVLARYKARYRAHLVVESRPYPGIEALLEALEVRGIPKAILTNKPHDAAVEVVARLFGRFRFEKVLGQREGVPRKPDPTGALAIARALDVPPEHCLVLGDTDTDMETARRAGMIAVGCLWGFRGREELEASGARYLIGAPLELLEQL
jgi:phosphoglycolate phosphatase